jgi:hypothetical protein
MRKTRKPLNPSPVAIYRREEWRDTREQESVSQTVYSNTSSHSKTRSKKSS